MDKNKGRRVGQVCITVRFDLYDHDVLAQVTGVVESVLRLNAAAQVQMTVVYGGKGGRRPLSAQEWETRFETARRVLALWEGEPGVTQEQACTRLGIPYGSFRSWRRRMRLTNK